MPVVNIKVVNSSGKTVVLSMRDDHPDFDERVEYLKKRVRREGLESVEVLPAKRTAKKTAESPTE